LGQLLKAQELHWTLADGRVKVTSKISARERERVASILKLLPPAEASKK
jgi:hypothetical protein